MANGIKSAAKHTALLRAIITLFARNFQPYFWFVDRSVKFKDFVDRGSILDYNTRAKLKKQGEKIVRLRR
ncbi:MAG: hypothetical protein Fur0044_29670 [Anaerolineae bacterium]